MAVVILIAVLFFFLYSPFFKLTTIERGETTFIPVHEIDTEVNDFLKQRRWWVFLQSNFFIMSKNDLARTLQDEFQLANINIDKEPPNTLRISYDEQIAVFLLAVGPEAETLQLIDHQGVMIQEIPRDDAHPALPLVVVPVSEYLSPELATLVLSAWDSVNTRSALFAITGFSVAEDDTLIATTDKGFEIRLNTIANVTQQLENLKALLATFTGGEPLPQEYIELRFSEKVFIK